MLTDLVLKTLIVGLFLGALGSMCAYVGHEYGFESGSGFAFLGALALASILLGLSPRSRQ